MDEKNALVAALNYITRNLVGVSYQTYQAYKVQSQVYPTNERKISVVFATDLFGNDSIWSTEDVPTYELKVANIDYAIINNHSKNLFQIYIKN